VGAFCFGIVVEESNTSCPPPVADEGLRGGVIGSKATGAIPFPPLQKKWVRLVLAYFFWHEHGGIEREQPGACLGAFWASALIARAFAVVARLLCGLSHKERVHLWLFSL